MREMHKRRRQVMPPKKAKKTDKRDLVPGWTHIVAGGRDVSDIMNLTLQEE